MSSARLRRQHQTFPSSCVPGTRTTSPLSTSTEGCRDMSTSLVCAKARSAASSGLCTSIASPRDPTSPSLHTESGKNTSSLTLGCFCLGNTTYRDTLEQIDVAKLMIEQYPKVSTGHHLFVKCIDVCVSDVPVRRDSRRHHRCHALREDCESPRCRGVSEMLQSLLSFTSHMLPVPVLSQPQMLTYGYFISPVLTSSETH